MRLPVEDSSPELVTENAEETASEAKRARPDQVGLWEQYGGSPLDTCIRKHAEKADNTDRRCAAT